MNEQEKVSIIEAAVLSSMDMMLPHLQHKVSYNQDTKILTIEVDMNEQEETKIPTM